MLSAAASLGLSFLWSPEKGLDAIDTYAYVPEEYIKAGAALANGIVHSGVKTEADAAFALLEEHVDSTSVPLRVCAIMGCVLVRLCLYCLCICLIRSLHLVQHRNRVRWHRAARHHGEAAYGRFRHVTEHGDCVDGISGAGLYLCRVGQWRCNGRHPADHDGEGREAAQ